MKYKNRKALLIGNDNYLDKKIRTLFFPRNNVRELKKILGNSRIISGYSVTSFLNLNLGDMEKKIKTFFTGNSPDDLLLFYFSGYETKINKQNKHFLYAKNTEKKDFVHTAYDVDILKNLVEHSGAGIKILLFDCCNADSFSAIQETFLHDNGVKSTLDWTGRGVAVLTSSYNPENPQKTKKMKYSHFTRYIIEGIEKKQANSNGNSTITFEELYDYVLLQFKKNAIEQIIHRNISASCEIPVIEYKNDKEIEVDMECKDVHPEPPPLQTRFAAKGWNEIKDNKEYSFFIGYIGFFKTKKSMTKIWNNYVDKYLETGGDDYLSWRLWVDREYFNDKIYRSPVINLTEKKSLSTLFKIAIDKQYNDFIHGLYNGDLQLRMIFLIKTMIYKECKDTVDKNVNAIFHLAGTLEYNKIYFTGNMISFLPARITDKINLQGTCLKDKIYSLSIKDIKDLL
ncbi:MAG: caspase family protein [Spirochaetales bacterium]|nr:caspase family protein [Spirochaetales bacterium]